MNKNDVDQTKLPAGVTIRHALRPGDIGYLTYLHGTLYARECGWDHTFEAYVAGPLAEFARSHTAREQIWLVEKEGTLAGSIAIVQAAQDVAQLRWLLLHPDLRGSGLGRILVEDAISFCRKNGYRAIYLWTECKLIAAANLYRATGFQLTEEKTHELWGTVVTEQRYDLELG
jgi:N-acetylglutamate synthase-like GNAT family acetyltransferase